MKEQSNVKYDRNFKTAVVICLIAVVLCLSIAYAALTQQLIIKGTAEVQKSSWNIKPDPDNPPTTDEGGDGSITYEQETHDGVTIIKNLKVILRKPGDYGSLTIPIKNTGDIDAHLSAVTGVNGKLSCTGTVQETKADDETIVCGSSDNTGASVKYTVTYDGKDLTNGIGDIDDKNLSSGDTKNVTVKVEYLMSATRIPTNTVNVTLPDISFVFSQNN